MHVAAQRYIEHRGLRVSSGWFYRGGDWYQLDDNSGFKIRASGSRQQWNNIVAVGSWNSANIIIWPIYDVGTAG